MELNNIDVLLGMIIACIILGMGLTLFFSQGYTGYGAVVLAIGMMTMSLMITARPRVIERVKREKMLQPTKPTLPAYALNPRDTLMTTTTHAENNKPSQASELQSAQPQTPESPKEQEKTQEAPIPTPTPS